MSFLFGTDRLGMIYASVKIHESTLCGSGVVAGTRFFSKGQIIQIRRERELSLSFPTYLLDMIYPTVKFHESIPLGLEVMACAEILAKGRLLKVERARVLIFLRDILSC